MLQIIIFTIYGAFSFVYTLLFTEILIHLIFELNLIQKIAVRIGEFKENFYVTTVVDTMKNKPGGLKQKIKHNAKKNVCAKIVISKETEFVQICQYLSKEVNQH